MILEAARSALDLCLSCKGCKGDCPVNVDMATYKAEFLSEKPEKIPLDTPYSSVIRSDVPVVVPHTRLDSRQAENALLSTIAFPGEE